jgi:N-acetylglucosamine kinase
MGAWTGDHEIADEPWGDAVLPLRLRSLGLPLHRFLHSKNATSRDIVEGWQLGDALASATIDIYCDLVAGPLAMSLNSFPATVVPVGGGLSSAHDLIAELDRRVRAQMLIAPSQPLLLPSGLGSDAGLLGALISGSAD